MKTFIRTAAPVMLILLFTYAGLSKLLTISVFRGELHNQTLPGWVAEVLLYTLIPLELLTALMLSFRSTEKWGLRLSVILMSLFTGYVGMVLLHVWDRIPCSCGGILKHMSWVAHLFLNAGFLLLSISALLFCRKGSEETLT